MSRSKPVEMVLVGIGGYGGSYVQAALADQGQYGARLVGAVDPAPEKTKSMAPLQAAGVPLFPTLDAFYANCQAELVVISAPIQYHAPLSIQALEHGSHVLCEKPVAATIQEALAMQQAATAAKRFLAIGYQWSFADAIQAIKQDVLAGRFGAPRRLKTLVSWPRQASYYGRASWAGALRAADGSWVLDSPVNNATAHYLHNMLYLLGEAREAAATPVAVQAELYRANPIGNYDTAALRCRTATDVDLLFYTSHAVPSTIGPICVFEFDNATLAYTGGGASAGFVACFDDGSRQAYDQPESTPCNKLWQTVAAIRGDAPPPACQVATAIPHLLCVNGAQESSPVGDFPAALIHIDPQPNGDSLRWVQNLQGVMVACFAAGLMPADLPEATWATTAQWVDLRGYRHFPRQA